MKKIIGIALLLAICIGGFIGYEKYSAVSTPNVPEKLANNFLEIPTGSDYQEVKNLLIQNGMLIDTAGFDWVAEKMNYRKNKMRSGRFEIQPGWSNRALIQHLRGGKQSPVKVVLNNERLLEEVAGKVARFIEADSLELITAFNDQQLVKKLGLNRETLMTLFIPNTYEFFWNQNANDFLERMKKEHEKFWSKNDRKAKAKKQNLSPEEVYTLASIVERESLQNSERPRIAGAYLNRIKRGIKLQADPTVVFATGKFDLRRVLNKHLEFDSPYNTYMYAGLPPGPISMSSISSIDAVLSPESHDYIFFCAKGDGSGTHSFAKTMAGHSQNIAVYKRNLKKRGLR